MTQTVKAGLEFLRGGKHCYIGQLRQIHQKVEIHSDDGDIAILSPEAFRREIVDGDIQMLVPDGDGVLHPVSQNWMERESACAKDERNKRAKILAYVDTEFRQGRHINQIVVDLKTYCHTMDLGMPPCERTLRNWRKLAKGHLSMLSPAWDRCGNRRQGPDDILLASIKEVVEVSILKSDRFTLTAAWGSVEALYDEQWRKKMGDLPVPRNSIRKLRGFVRAMPWKETVKLRLDGKTARALTRSAVYRNTATVLWECVEMDATVLDVLVCNEKGIEVGRPVLYVAIDVATGYIVGLHLTIQKPSALPFVECLRYMFFPKPDGFDLKYGLINRIEVFGKPMLLRVDNGSEFIGRIAVELVRQLFSDTARCQPYKPEEKPHVERFNGTLKTYVLTLPGATTSSVTGAQRTPPKNEKLLTLEQLREKIYKFVYDRYSLQCNELRSLRAGKAVAPVDIVRQLKSTFTEPVPVSREEFERSLCFKRDNRPLSHVGISFDGWHYHSDELKSLYEKMGSVKCDFLYSDLDPSIIQVTPPGGEGESIPAYDKDLEGTNADRATAKTIKAQLKAESIELNRRTFAHKLAEFRELQKSVKGSRSRAKAERVNDMLKTAEDHQRRTMPKMPVASDISDAQTYTPGPSDFMNNAPRGRKSGEKK
jgi:transposase InsO family protein